MLAPNWECAQCLPMQQIAAQAHNSTRLRDALASLSSCSLDLAVRSLAALRSLCLYKS